MFNNKDKNLRQRRCLELLKNYYMSVLYHPGKANRVTNALSRLSIGSIVHIEGDRKVFVRDFHRLSPLGFQLVNRLYQVWCYDLQWFIIIYSS